MKTILLTTEHSFSFEIDEETDKYYLAIPLSNRWMDYMELYEVPKNMVENYPLNIKELESIVLRCQLSHQAHSTPYKRAQNRDHPK